MTTFQDFNVTGIQTEPTAPPAQTEIPPTASEETSPVPEVATPKPDAAQVQGPAADKIAEPVFEQKKEESPQQKAEQAKQLAAVMKTNKNGLIVAANMDEEWRICTALARSGMVPKGMNTPEKLFVARQFAAELGLPLMSSLRNICVINGSPSLWGDLPLALARRTKEMVHFDEYWVDKSGARLKAVGDEDKIFAAVCEIERKGEPRKTYAFTEYDVKVARLDQKDIWKLYPRRMRQMRARSWAIKDVFGDALMGAAIAEYDFDMIPGEEGVYEVDMNADKKKSSLNDSFGSAQGALPVPETLKGAAQ